MRKWRTVVSDTSSNVHKSRANIRDTSRVGLPYAYSGKSTVDRRLHVSRKSNVPKSLRPDESWNTGNAHLLNYLRSKIPRHFHRLTIQRNYRFFSPKNISTVCSFFEILHDYFLVFFSNDFTDLLPSRKRVRRWSIVVCNHYLVIRDKT